jgi:hypothetical protein
MLTKATGVVPASSFADISAEWKRFLKEAQAIKWGTGKLVNGKTVEEAVKEELDRVSDDGGVPKFSNMFHVMMWTKSRPIWRCLCTPTGPADESLRF